MGKTCNGCGEHTKKEMPESVPYIVHESTMARSERQIKRMWIALIVAISLLFASNAIWLYAWCQYDYSSETEEYIYQQDGEGTNIIGDSNEVNNGAESDSTEEETDKNP